LLQLHLPPARDEEKKAARARICCFAASARPDEFAKKNRPNCRPTRFFLAKLIRVFYRGKKWLKDLGYILLLLGKNHKK
jgi:hypothetical protein